MKKLWFTILFLLLLPINRALSYSAQEEEALQAIQEQYHFESSHPTSPTKRYFLQDDHLKKEEVPNPYNMQIDLPDSILKSSYIDEEGVINKKGFNDAADHIIRQVLEKGQPTKLGIIHTDLDGMKAFNDISYYQVTERAVLERHLEIIKILNESNLKSINFRPHVQGDESYILIEGTLEEILAVAKRIANIRQRFIITKNEIGRAYPEPLDIISAGTGAIVIKDIDPKTMKAPGINNLISKMIGYVNDAIKIAKTKTKGKLMRIVSYNETTRDIVLENCNDPTNKLNLNTEDPNAKINTRLTKDEVRSKDADKNLAPLRIKHGEEIPPSLLKDMKTKSYEILSKLATHSTNPKFKVVLTIGQTVATLYSMLFLDCIHQSPDIDNKTSKGIDCSAKAWNLLSSERTILDTLGSTLVGGIAPNQEVNNKLIQLFKSYIYQPLLKGRLTDLVSRMYNSALTINQSLPIPTLKNTPHIFRLSNPIPTGEALLAFTAFDILYQKARIGTSGTTALLSKGLKILFYTDIEFANLRLSYIKEIEKTLISSDFLYSNAAFWLGGIVGAAAMPTMGIHYLGMSSSSWLVRTAPYSGMFIGGLIGYALYLQLPEQRKIWWDKIIETNLETNDKKHIEMAGKEVEDEINSLIEKSKQTSSYKPYSWFDDFYYNVVTFDLPTNFAFYTAYKLNENNNLKKSIYNQLEGVTNLYENKKHLVNLNLKYSILTRGNVKSFSDLPNNAQTVIRNHYFESVVETNELLSLINHTIEQYKRYQQNFPNPVPDTKKGLDFERWGRVNSEYKKLGVDYLDWGIVNLLKLKRDVLTNGLGSELEKNRALLN